MFALYGSSDDCIQPDDGLNRNGRNMQLIRYVHYNIVVFLTAILCILVFLSSLPCSQNPATCSYPEPDQSSPAPSPHPIFLRSILMLAFPLRLCLPRGLFNSSIHYLAKKNCLFSMHCLSCRFSRSWKELYQVSVHVRLLWSRNQVGGQVSVAVPRSYPVSITPPLLQLDLTCFYFRCRTASYKSVSGRSCDRPPRHRFFLVSLCLQANSEMVPKLLLRTCFSCSPPDLNFLVT